MFCYLVAKVSNATLILEGEALEKRKVIQIPVASSAFDLLLKCSYFIMTIYFLLSIREMY